MKVADLKVGKVYKETSLGTFFVLNKFTKTIMVIFLSYHGSISYLPYDYESDYVEGFYEIEEYSLTRPHTYIYKIFCTQF